MSENEISMAILQAAPHLLTVPAGSIGATTIMGTYSEDGERYGKTFKEGSGVEDNGRLGVMFDLIG